MKRRWKIAAGLVVLAAVCALLWPGTGNRAQQELEETRRSLRQQGFKIDLREFNLSTSPEQARRVASLGTTTWAALTNRPPRAPIMRVMPALLTPAGTNAALVAWRLEKLPPYRSPEPWPLSGTGYLDMDLWPELRKTLKANRARLEAARQAALSGPIRFEPIRGPRPNMLLPYLSDIRDLTAAFGMQTLLALHEGDRDAAWTNLLATTCLVTAYHPEPIDQSHLVRFACAATAYDITWNALQSRDWTDQRLAELQRRWEAVDFWGGLPQTAAWTRANAAATCQLERRQPPSVPPLNDLLHSPREAWFRLTQYWHWLRYRNQGGYQDEKAVLLYYRDRELELRRALRSPTWSEMRQLPGITNLVPSRPGISLRMQAHMNTQVLLSAFYLRGQGLLGRAAEAEARRRLLVTALALERYRGRHGSYPAALEQLVPELLNSPPADFMDGKPLRYRVAEDGHFVLYSTGLDCVDNAGQMGRPALGLPYSVAWGGDSWQGSDLVWPRPASVAEVELLRQREKQARAQQIDRMEEMQAAAQWDRTARRQAELQTILLGRPAAITREPVYRGRPLSEVLRNAKASGTNKLTLADLLTLKQIITGAEPETATFELPLNFDVLTNVASLRLYIDPTTDEDPPWGCDVGQVECNRATNGNCLLVCSTIYESPGDHALQVRLFGTPSELDADIAGPLAPFVVSNLCQFSLSSAYFDPESGATFRAKLPELNGACSVELRSPTGERLKTITATTSNGILKVHWDLRDERGTTCTNASFDSVFRVTLPDSHRAQTLRGP